MMTFKLNIKQNKKNNMAIFLSSCVLLLSTHTYAAEPTALDNIAAIVNDDVILMSELKENVQQVQSSQKAGINQKQLYKNVLEQMIMGKIQVQRAKDLGIKIDDAAVNTALQTIARQNNMELPQLRTAIIQRGMDYKDFRENIRERLFTDALRQRQQRSSNNISDNEVNDFIQSESFNFSQNIQYNLIDIVIPNKNSSVQEFNNNLQNAQSLRKKLLKNANLSSTEINKLGGTQKNLGWKSAETLSPIYSRTLSLMEEGELSEVFRDTQGLHILKLVEQKGGQRQQAVEAKVRHILIGNEIPNAQSKAVQIRNQILSGQSFAALAKEHSLDTSSSVNGGELPMAQSSNYVPPFAKVVDTIALNTLSQPVQTRFGWHLIEVLERKTSDQTRLAIQDQAKQRVSNKKRTDDQQNWLKSLRENAFVEYRIQL